MGHETKIHEGNGVDARQRKNSRAGTGNTTERNEIETHTEGEITIVQEMEV